MSDIYELPDHHVFSTEAAADWQEGLVTGNGRLGAVVPGGPYRDSVYFSEATLFMPFPKSGEPAMAPYLEEFRSLCLAGDFQAAAERVNTCREEAGLQARQDVFIGAFRLELSQEQLTPTDYRRGVNFMSAETCVEVRDEKGLFKRQLFVSRADDLCVLKLESNEQRRTELAFTSLPLQTDQDREIYEQGIQRVLEGTKQGLLYYRADFEHTHTYNTCSGYEAAGLILKNGRQVSADDGAVMYGEGDEVLILISLRPLPRTAQGRSQFNKLKKELFDKRAPYSALLERQSSIHGALMGRVSLSLDAPREDRLASNEVLIDRGRESGPSAALMERIFNAGRYNIICSTGASIPNLLGLWSGSLYANWQGGYTHNGNVASALAFMNTGNTPELMKCCIDFHRKRWDGYKENNRQMFGARGFHIPAQMSVSPRQIAFSGDYPHHFWHSGAAWVLFFFYDYYLHTGDREFLRNELYPLMKEACGFYEDFLIDDPVSDTSMFVPSYSPENTPVCENRSPCAINATIDVSAAKQLLANTIRVAAELDRDQALQEAWQRIINRLPNYEVSREGYFREWLWPGLDENPGHRHASQLYALYDERPADILGNNDLREAVCRTLERKIKFYTEGNGFMSFGLVQVGLVAAHVQNREITEQAIKLLASNYWSPGMASYHNYRKLFNMDISGGLPRLCVASLIYSDPGYIHVLPVRPEDWTKGTLRGIRLRGNILVTELSWELDRATVRLVSGTTQDVTIEGPSGHAVPHHLPAGKEIAVKL